MIGKIKSKLAQDKHLSDLVNSSIISFILRIVGIVFGYIYILIVSRHLGAAAVGVFTLAFTVLQIVAILGRFGLDTALLRFITESVSNGKLSEAAGTYIKAIFFVFIVSFILSVLMYMSSAFIAVAVFKNTVLELPFEIASTGIIPFALTYLNFETLRAMKMIRAFAFIQNVATYMFATLFLLLALTSNMTANTVVVVFIAAVWSTWMISQYKVLRVFKGYIGVAGRRFDAMLKTSFPMMIASSLMLIMGWTDTVMIGIFMDASSVGSFSVAMKVAAVTSITLMAINSMAAPKFAEFYTTKDMVSLRQVVRHSSMLIFWSSVPILLVCVVFPEFILGLFGEEFKNAAWVLIILSMGQFINAISGSVGYILQMTGKEAVFQKIIIAAILINIFLNYILIPSFGINGAAIASMIGLGVWNLISVFYIKIKYEFWTVAYCEKRK